MPEAPLAFDGWLLKTTLAGGVVLLIGTLWMAFTRQPVKRQRIGELALLAALLVALPAAMPSWWSLPGSTSTTSKALFGKSLPSRLDGSNIDADKLLAVIDQNETEEEWDPIDLVDYLYTLRREEKEEIDTAAIVNPSDNVIEHNCAQGDSSPLFPQWGRWMLRLIGFAYLGLVAVLLIRCSIGYYGLWRFWRQRRPAPAHVHIALAELEPDPAHRPRIGVNSLVHGPVSYGLWKPTILLPPAFCNEGDPEKLRWILAHELTHLRRRDAWGCLLLALGGALFFHVPWFWWMKRHVRLAQEYLADAAAARIANAVEYAQYLVSLTTLTSRPSLASSQAVGVFESPSDLYRRVHMLLHQRTVVERGTPRWWTLTAAASFLALAACTAGINLFADEPPKTDDNRVTFVVRDDGKDGDKKKAETKTVTVNGKIVQSGDGKTFTWTSDDGAAKPGIWTVQGGALSQDKKKSIDDAMKKLEQVLAKLPRELDGDTRAKLEELKKTLKALKEGDQAVWLRAAEAAKEDRVRARVRSLDALKDGENQRKAVEEKVVEARSQVLAAREHAMATEKLARVAQEKALLRWKEAKDGDDKDQAIKELERAIAEKERALKALKADGANVTSTTRVTRPAQRSVTNPAVASSSKGRLGVVVADIDGEARGELDIAEGQGLMIQEVIDPSPAWNNGRGLRSSDVIVELAGKKVPANQEKFREMVSKLPEGTCSAVVYRKGKKMTIAGIKLPAVEKARTVVVDGNDPKLNLTFDLVNRNPEAMELVLKDKLVNDLHDKINLTIKPEIVTAHDQLIRVQKQLHDKQADLDLAHAKIAKGDVVIARPEVSLKLDDAHIVLDNARQQLEKVQIAPGTFKVNTAPLVAKILSSQDQAAGKPRLGVTLEEVPEVVASQIELAEDRGLFVREVSEGSAAQKAGILKNDIIIEFAGKPVSKDHAAFTQLIKELKPGKYTATVVRKGKEIRIRDINLADTKAAAEEKKAKLKEWLVDGDDKKHEEVKEKMKEKDSFKKKDDFFPQAGRGFNLARGPAGNTSVTINNDEFTTSHSNNGKTITMTGKMVNGKAEPKSITIKTDEGEKKFKSAKDVPEEDRAAVEKMLSSFKGNVFQWNGNGQAFFNQGQLDKQIENQMKIFERSMKQIGEGNPGFEQMEKEIERLREQLKKMHGNKDKDDDNNN